MPRLEDLPNPLKSAPPYQRKRLRPWDDISALKPVSDAHKGAEKPENVGQQLVNNKETNWITHPPSSSIYKTTTTKEPVDNFLPPEWRLVKIEPLEEIGFTHQHLNQLANQGKLQASIVQESIHTFSFDLRHNGKSEKLKSSPLNYLMGILRNGQPYAPPANYESPTQEAWRLYYERKETIRKRQQELEAKLAALSFDEWLEKEVTEEQKKEIIPAMIYKLPSEAPKLVQMRQYFLKAVWPEKRKKS